MTARATVGQVVAEKLAELERPGRVDRAAQELVRMLRLDWDVLTEKQRKHYRACAASILDAADGDEVKPWPYR